VEIILRCRAASLEPDYDNVTLDRNREHRALPELQVQPFSVSVVRQKPLPVKMFFFEILVDCTAGLGIGSRLET
jgi:hypothetical protein